ncbi:c-type cytochrome [Desulfatitalea alkaliphila]|uniref:Cytochrome c n=1 Tax=Desulfatitalea alkaliphila TaxID=2929485 RepID=A0AA41QYX5_9BACT|nr:cytochrome c [Desulfatitalea alkaliphila]MCJ8499038.1 cytochrome c [Desulfatitalea alkaliphila]
MTVLKRTSAGVILVLAAGGIIFAALSSDITKADSGAIQGLRIFENNCAGCHFADQEASKRGPGLKNLFARETLPATGRPVTIENVVRQLKEPFKNMPSFVDDLSESEMEAVAGYLETL